MDLSEIRKEIDAVDKDLVRLFARRMELSAAVADYKQQHSLPVLDKKREKEKLAAVAALAPDGLREDTEKLYTLLFSLSREYQTRLLAEKQRPLSIGLIGKKLGHSYSPEIHRRLGMSYSYTLTEIPDGSMETFLKTTGYDGFNVTIPYKKEILPFLTGLSDTAKRLGSVNTVVRKDGGFFGYNTDYTGFAYMLSYADYAVRGKKAVVIGSGGVCPAVCAVLADAGAGDIAVISHAENTETVLSAHRDADLLVNASPVGMYPGNLVSPVSLDCFPHLACVLDLIYNPFETALLADARRRGCKTASGISMLTAQAQKSAELFTGTPCSDDNPVRIVREMIRSRRNLILIGMPGSGKTTLGRLLAEALGRTFIDTDREIEKSAGLSIPEIFERDGEEAFRTLEHQTICEVCKKSGCVIAAGGGCVTRTENYAPMAQNGMILCLDRPLSLLAVEGRPLSLKTSPEVLYRQRKSAYEAFADQVLPNTGSAQETLSLLLTAAETELPRLR